MANPTASTAGPPARPIPGPRGLPILGVAPRLLGDPLEFFPRIARQYGDLVALRLGRRTMYLALHPDMIRRVTQEHVRNYVKRYGKIRDLLGDGLVTSNGDFWLRQRRLMQPAFHHQRISAMAAMMAEETRQMLDRWEPHARSGRPLDVAAEMLDLAQAIIVRTMFSTSLRGDGRRIGDAFNLTLAHATERQFQAVKLPESWPTPANRRYAAALAYLERTVYGLIDERRRSAERHDDLLGMLVEAQDADTGEQMSPQQIRDEVMTIFLAGHETTAGSLAWALHTLARHGDAERRLRAEYAAALAGRDPTPADLPQLPYGRMVFDEILRLYPATWILTRVALEADRLGDYAIPAGSMIALSPYTTHRHPEFWERPESFDPERFSPEAAAGRHKFAYFPFLTGPRQCIGNSFALMEMQIILPMILQRYRLSAIPGYPVRAIPRATLRPGPHLWMQVAPA